MPICPTCGKSFDERAFHVFASGRAFDRAECALVALERGVGAGADVQVVPAAAAVAGGPSAAHAGRAMMAVVRTRLPLGLLLAALAASAILSVYLWLRAFGAGPAAPPKALSLAPAEHRSVATLPQVARRVPVIRRRATAHRHRAAPRRTVVAAETQELSAPASRAGDGTLISASAPKSPPSAPPSPPSRPSPPAKPSTPPPSPPPSPPANPSPPPPASPPTPPPAPAPPTPPPAPSPPPSPAAKPPEQPPTNAPSEQPASSPDSTKPGWGYGDQNHTHTGPPGQGAGSGKKP
ncbi:MAG TPA: hypothetical protein VF101_03700 [Gaiellaceae bacterium]